ncbi:SMI1/KNR4 family protein [Streptomyces sp. AK02-01A]|uniref:SMI1/KNR4 family protein n=1 Tax=Streptomyces sp. AK02-01A TaxID=3028648 RepID=UPI0029B128B4|nr:SMI1/KNR4 family protein [Streptomyces sp. AK02-01A]MDX3849504.1 SMI1/KNR4 family protein [Streptomyces sp. AK02-01A]MDX3849926.1 SMI1/KNR4 family protein [Streptomyces sp. AK02-01A]
MKIYNWRPFLERWSEDWVDSAGALGQEVADEQVPRERWLGFAPADEDRIEALEERLGVALPPTYRSFLAATDGWRPAGTSVRLMGTAEGVHWHADPGGLQEIYESDLGESPSEEEVLTAGMWGRALQLSLDSDMTDVLLDPGDVNADGEWAAYVHRGWSGEYPDRYESFTELMQALFKDFHRVNGDRPGFVNETTRELDAAVEGARVACLGGDDIDGQLDVFAEAEESGRVRARGLRVQVEAMLGGGEVSSRVAGGLDDPLYAHEFLPLAAREHLRSRRGEAEFVQPHDGADRERALAVFREIGELTFRYEPPGPFGDAVAVAREQARWGDTDAAWRTVAAAVPDWQPYGSEHVAPVGLLADPLLGPVITPERGRYILETPRGERAEEAPAWDDGEEAAPEPDGLAWLADQEPAEPAGSYRFVLVHGVSPEELAGRIGKGPLLAPSGERDLSSRHGSDEHGVARLGSSGDGWSFAFESRPEAFRPGRLNGVDESVSRGAKSVAVWVERGGLSGAFPGSFHFSYAEDGRRVYGFTARGGEIERWGTLPGSLAPEDLFPATGSGGPALDPDDEYEALSALTETFGVSLPRFAIEHGRLHAVAAEPWVAPPGPEEPPVGARSDVIG